MRSREIAVLNLSTLVSAKDHAAMSRACNQQLRDDVTPLWGLPRRIVRPYAKGEAVPADAYVITLFDDADQADALGWHTESPQGKVYGKVFAKPVLDNGGDALTKPLSVASVLSHEVIEAYVDPTTALWAAADDGLLYAYEACDPVESDSYVGMGDVTVSDFVTPAWFDPQGHGRFDFLGRLSKPFTMTKGGYVVYMQGGQESQRFGEHYPDWRLAMKGHPASRTARRAEQDPSRHRTR